MRGTIGFWTFARASLLATLAAIFTLAAPVDGRANTMSYNFVGFVEASQLPEFTLNQIVSASFTLDTSSAVAQPQLNGPNQILYSGAITGFQFDSIGLTPPYQNNIVSVANNFYNNVGYVNQFYVESTLPNGNGALMIAGTNTPTPSQSFINSLAIPTSLNFSLAEYFSIVYYIGSGQQVDIGFSPVGAGVVSATPLPEGLPLFASGLAILGLLGWQKKQRMQPA
jgi:hypothetical protein